MTLIDSLTPAERRQQAAAKKAKKERQNLKRHELSSCYPDIGDDDLRELATSIASGEQRKPIELYDGEVLDGWQRYRACLLAKVDPWTTDVTAELRDVDLADYVQDLNGKTRRHLDPRSLAFAAAKLAQTEYYKNRAKAASGRRNDLTSGSKEPEVTSQRATVQAAKAVGASVASTKRAAKVLKDGAKATVEAMESGDIPLTTAAKISAKPKSEQPAAVRQAKAEKNGKPLPSKRVLFRACEKAFGELLRNSTKLGLDIEKYRTHFNAIIAEVNRLGGKV